MNDSQAHAAHVADRMIDAVQRMAAPVCVGLDPVVERLPQVLLERGDRSTGSIVQMIESFCCQVVDAVCESVPCVKPQSACFERYGWQGVRALATVVAHARERGLIVILDAKRGDIGISASHYAAGAFESEGVNADWVTINPYLGDDAMMPFMERTDRGAFALVRTSNPGGERVQGLELAGGSELSAVVASMVAELGERSVGEHGFSNLGAVVGATKPQAAEELRSLMPQQLFLVPGYGAQGGGVDDVLPCFREDGLGAIVTASRSVIFTSSSDDPKWTTAVAEAASAFADEVGRATGLRR